MENLDIIAFATLIQNNKSTTLIVLVVIALMFWGKNVPELFRTLIDWLKNRKGNEVKAKKETIEIDIAGKTYTEESQQRFITTMENDLERLKNAMDKDKAEYKKDLNELKESNKLEIKELRDEIMSLKQQIKIMDDTIQSRTNDNNKLQAQIGLKNTEIYALRTYIDAHKQRNTGLIWDPMPIAFAEYN